MSSLCRHLLRRRPSTSSLLRRFSTSTRSHQQHEFLPATPYIDSWQPSRNPREAAAQLAFLRQDYDRKVKQIRKEYIEEVEAQRIERSRKDEVRKEALRVANEERKAAKVAKKKAEAIERQAADEEFRCLLTKERAEKLEYWRTRETKIQDKKKEKNELLRRQSSLWVDESELEKKIFEAVIDTTSLEQFRVHN